MDRKPRTSTLKVFTAFSVLLITCPGSSIASDEYKFYGAFKVSINATDDGDQSNLSASNNSSRIGIKGGKNLQQDLDLIYQLEMEFDTTEREKFNSGRNSFIGVKTAYGKIMVGQHDTPLKDVRDKGADIFGDTIADVRSIISAIANDDGTHLDDRARNAIIYYSPKVNNTRLFALYSADTSASGSTDDNDNDLSSVSIVHHNGPLYLGIAYQNKALAGDDLTVTRVAASYKFGDYQIGGVAEASDAGSNNSLTRDAAALNLRYNLNPKTWTGIQLGQAKDYDGSSNTGATNVSLGIYHSLADKTKVYVVASATNNDDNASFGLSQGGIQDKTVAFAPGDNVAGVSTGIVHKF